MRALLVLFLLCACRAAPTFEPIGGFELVRAPKGSWSELPSAEFERLLAEASTRAQALADYRARLETRERIDDALHPRRVLDVCVARQPFRVAATTHAPENERGQRVWFDESRNGGKLLAETPGFLGSLVGRLSLDPQGDLALANRRHPLTDIGLVRLVEQVEEALRPALEHTPPPRLRCTEAALGSGTGRLVEALLPGEYGEPALLHRFGFEPTSGLLVYYGLAELQPEGPALLEEFLYLDVQANPGLSAAELWPVK